MTNHPVTEDSSSEVTIEKTRRPKPTCTCNIWTWPSRTAGILISAGVLCGLGLILGLGLGLGLPPSNSFPSDVSSQSTLLPSYPLAVKSPYLSAWVPGQQLQKSATAQPEFWNGVHLTWPILARVNGTVYSLFGNAQVKAATTTAVNYTASHTYIYVSIPDADFIIDFFSPVLPGESDYARQSLPYSYVTVTATSSSKNPVSVQVLSAIDYTWTAQNGRSQLNYTTSGNAGFWWFINPDAIPYTEHNQMASVGSVVFGTQSGTATSSACDSTESIFDTFTKQGSLSKKAGPCSRKDLAALSNDLGLCGSTARNVTFTVGVDRDQAVNFLNTTTYTGYHRTRWPTIPRAVQFVLQQYPQVFLESIAFDDEVQSRAKSLSNTWGTKYAAIIDASVRQAFGSIELTVPIASLANTTSFNRTVTIPPTAFIKEISTDGNINTVDYVSHLWPMLICLNPAYIRFLVEPILSYLSTNRYPHPWVVHDLGHHYPNVTGHDDGQDESMPNYETSTLFILMHAYLKFTGDATFAQRYIKLLRAHAEWLATNSLYPAKQLMNVDFITASANQTLLSIMSTIALRAAYHVTSNATYLSIADSNVNAIYTNGLGLDGTTPSTSSHFTYNYGLDETWSVLYPTFADVALNLSTFPAKAWEMQSTWYLQQMTQSGLPFGRTKEKSLQWGSTDVNIMAASISSPALQESVVASVHDFLANNVNSNPFGAWYYVDGRHAGKWLKGKAKATVGGNFAIMAIDQGYWYKK